ncbi:MAG: hypothetical protein MZU91_06925 [Desulfosudis oleivorans]|nr:hypothetical protein [Desulfosudis oleivorans]
MPLSRTRLHEEIVEQLKDRIIRGDFVPDSKLSPSAKWPSSSRSTGPPSVRPCTSSRAST